MFILRSVINDLSERLVNDEIYVKNRTVFVNTTTHNYKYSNGIWYIKVGDLWIDLQGGIPTYSTDINSDTSILMEVDKNAIEER